MFVREWINLREDPMTIDIQWSFPLDPKNKQYIRRLANEKKLISSQQFFTPIITLYRYACKQLHKTYFRAEIYALFKKFDMIERRLSFYLIKVHSCAIN